MNSIYGFITTDKSTNPDEVLNRFSSSEKMPSIGEVNSERKVFKTQNGSFGVGFNCTNEKKNLADIQDVSLITNDDYVTLFHGSIYNKAYLLKSLYGSDSLKVTETDAALVLETYIKYHEGCVKHLNGRYVFVIINKKDQSVFVGRDRLGKVRFYYYHNGTSFVFSTRIEAVMQFPNVEKKINTEILSYVMRFGYVPTPLSIYQDVYKLEAGTTLSIKGKHLIKNRYWGPLDAVKQQKPFKGSYESAIDHLDKVLTEALQIRLEGTNSVGALLSSGIDSSLIAAMLQKELGRELTTFTIGIHDKRFNEADLAKQIAKYLGTNHKEYYISENDFLNCVENISTLIDEPFGDSGLISMMVVTKIASQEVGTVFGGDGGDEVFEGYLHYHFVNQAQSFDWAGSILNAVVPDSIVRKMPHSIQYVIYNRNSSTKSQLVIPYELNVYQRILSNPALPPYYAIEDSMGIDNWELRRQIIDMETGFVDDAIQKSDLATRYGNLDLRSPLIDYHVAEFSLSLPTSYKTRGTVNKRILRDLAYKYVPKDLLDLPKRGFSVPIDKWMESVLSDEIKILSSDSYLTQQGLFNGAALRDAIEKSHTIKWNFFIFQKWYINNF